ncbi:histidine kinase [Allostella vacuolata]|nr:histidine kinase [Stella vacuolata]
MERDGRPGPGSTEQDRYRLLIDSVIDYAICMLDPDGIVTTWNTGARRFKGYEPAEIIGQHFSQFYVEEDRRAGVPQRALETAAREGRFESEGWRVRRDGSHVWTHVVIDPIRTGDGRLLGFAKITRDLTRRRQMQDSLRRSEQQFALLVQSVTDHAIYMLDPDGLISSWNLGAERIKGYRAEEIIGQHFSRFYPPEDREQGEPARALETALAEGRYEREAWRLRRDGTRFLANVVIEPVRDERGQLVGYAKVTRDVTERAQARRALEQAREALFQAQKMDALGQLTGGVAHDFNNLLMAILGSLELVQRRLPDDPRIRALIDNAVQGARRGASLTQRLLAFARRQELRLEPVDLPLLVHGMTDLLQRSLGPALPIEARFPLMLPPVMADPNQLELALLNLMVNARDAMPGGGSIVVGAREAEAMPGSPPGERRHVCLWVRDVGIGMDEATLARAAEPFFTTKGVGKGTGLGLAMVHGLAEQLGGRLVLKSRLGEGTTAELWLPAAAAASPPAPGPAASPGASPPTGPALTVLAVDDDGLVLTNTAAMLEDLGHRVLRAASGDQALAILRGGDAVDLVVTDHAMPEMTGAQLAEAIAADWPGLPILLTTGFAELPPTATPLPRLAKPFTQQELAQAVGRAVRGRPIADGDRIVAFPGR